MENINTVFVKAIELNRSIGSLLRLSTYKDYDDLSGLTINYEDGEQLLILDELRTIMDKLADVENTISYLTHPVAETSRLFRNESGRFETKGGHYYTSGYGIEALIADDRYEVPHWVRTSVEHNGRDYYLVGHRDISLDGLTVRVRKAV